MNSESSRSHSVFTCIIESRWGKDSMTHFRFARLNLVDLAGSERCAIFTICFFFPIVLSMPICQITCLIIQAERLWCRGRSFERSSKYKQIIINSWVLYQGPISLLTCFDTAVYLEYFPFTILLAVPLLFTNFFYRHVAHQNFLIMRSYFSGSILVDIMTLDIY